MKLEENYRRICDVPPGKKGAVYNVNVKVQLHRIINMDKIKAALDAKKEIGFDVTHPRKSYAGHTVYRLQLKVYSGTELNAHYEFLGWKRFNDFKKLYKELKNAYADLFLQAFPGFAKGKIFGRFDENVIEERRKAALRLLMFTVIYPEMLHHPAFKTFLNCGGSQITPYLKEAENNKEEEEEEEEEVVDEAQTSTELDDSTEPLSPIEHRTESDSPDTSLGTDPPDNLNECIIEDSSDTEEGDVFISNSDGRESWLLEARSICGDDLESLALEAADEEFPVTPRVSITEDTSVLLSEPLNDIRCPSPVPEDSSSLSLLSDNSSLLSDNSDTEGDSKDTVTEEEREELNQLVDDNQNIPITPPDIDLCSKFKVDEKMSKIIEKTVEEDDYVFQASVAMSNAIELEEGGNVEGAFDMYKFGIGLLLRGVQTDDNVDRREAVRRKTAQYLLRAEELYKSSIKSSVEDETVTDLSSLCEDNKWRFRLSDVKVFGIIDKVMLVQKVFSDDVFIMKVLHKQGGEYKRRYSPKKTSKQPRNLYNCRFMVKLMNCVETQTGVYLLLQHVTGGKLWDYLNISIFHKRLPSFNDTHHSLDDYEHSNNDETDIVDIPCHSYTRQGQNELRGRSPSKLSCKIKRSPSSSEGLSEDDTRLWAAQIAMALMDLHSKGVICRDLNPRNILIDSNGNIKLTYFSNVDGIDYPLDVNAVNNMYTSPEVDGVFEPTHATDWWSYGAILFELLTGELLKYDAKERLGAGPSGNEEIKSHPFFAKIHWDKLK